MDDTQLLYAGMKMCSAYYDDYSDSCFRCPLNEHMCINKNGKLVIKDGKKDDKIYFVEFVEEFKNMVRVIRDEEPESCIEEKR